MPLQFLLRNVVQRLLLSAKKFSALRRFNIFFLFLNKEIKRLPLQFIAEKKKITSISLFLPPFPPSQ